MRPPQSARPTRILVTTLLITVSLVNFLAVMPQPPAKPIAQPSVLGAAKDYYDTPSPSPIASPSLAPAPAAPVAPATPASAGRFGIAAGSSLTDLSATELDRRLTDMASLGVTWIRYDLEWPNIQPTDATHYDWADADRVVAAANAHRLHSIAILDYTPTWARLATCSDNPKCHPADPVTYARFAAAATSRYLGQGVHTWEIWNEPNAAAYFAPAADPAAYTQLLRAASTTIHRLDPAAIVLTGGLAPAGSSDGNLSPTDFVTQLYAAGAAGSFDALADHPYTYPVPAGYPNPYNAWGQLTTIHDIMVAHGDAAKPIWITEYGAPTGGPGPTAHLSDYLSDIDTAHVDEMLQAAIVTDVITQYRSLPWLGPFLWYTYQDAGTTADTNENFFGLLRANGSRKPAYAAFKQAISTR